MLCGCVKRSLEPFASHVGTQLLGACVKRPVHTPQQESHRPDRNKSSGRKVFGHMPYPGKQLQEVYGSVMLHLSLVSPVNSLHAGSPKLIGRGVSQCASDRFEGPGMNKEC